MLFMCPRQYRISANILNKYRISITIMTSKSSFSMDGDVLNNIELISY